MDFLSFLCGSQSSMRQSGKLYSFRGCGRTHTHTWIKRGVIIMKNSSLDKEMLSCNQLVSKRSSEEKSHKKVAKKFAIMITKSQCNILSQ